MFTLDKPSEYARNVLLLDVSELLHQVRTDPAFALLHQYVPEVFLFDTCWDFDTFYSFLSDIRNNIDEADVDFVLNDKVYDEIEYQGVTFVELYRNHYILPAVMSVSADQSYHVGGMTTNQQVMISY